MMNKAIFLDRDGVINEENGYITKWEDFKILPQVVESIRLLKEQGFLIIVITNQSGIAKGLCTEEDVCSIHQKFNEFLAQYSTSVDGFYFCPHHPNGIVKEYSITCHCRKPENGMILEAAEELNIDLSSSYLIGDAERDIIAGKQSGLTTLRVMTGHTIKTGETLPNFLVEDIYEATQMILQLS